MREEMQLREDGSRVLTKIFDYGALHVWGATGRMLQGFLDAWAAPGSDLRRELEPLLMQEAGGDVYRYGDDRDVEAEGYEGVDQG